MSMSKISYDDFMLPDARLIIIKELERQADGRLNETLIQKTLDIFGHRHSIDWLREQLLGLEKLGAIKTDVLSDKGFMVATLAKAGVDHLDRREFIDGIAKPSLGV